MPVQHALPIRTGSPAYIMPRFEERGFVRALGEFEITQTVVVPPILMALSKRSSAELGSLRKIFVGGSVATNGMQQQLYSSLHADARIVQVYGMTEVGWATTWTRDEKDESGSVGQALPGTKIRYFISSRRYCRRKTNSIDSSPQTAKPSPKTPSQEKFKSTPQHP